MYGISSKIGVGNYIWLLRI